MSTDTIAAVGTALSNSGISIIRISGKDSLKIVKKIFKTTYDIKPNNIIYGKIINNNKVLDTTLVSYFKSPKSYTGEDVCEINCHGGNEITKQILELVLDSGARMAEPGEFSKRAFLNGKIDLTKAEAIINLINSKTSTEARIASNNLEGDLYNKIKEIREELVELLAHIEVSIDYPEYDYEEVKSENVVKILDRKLCQVDDIVNTYEQGRYIKDGINVAILGRPNVGKSSLLNLLAKYEKAIVTNIPGTTRDIIEERINIGNLILNISDTAGIRETYDTIEKIGVQKSLKKIGESDLVLYILNAEEKITVKDIEMISEIKKKDIKLIVVINKIDKVEKLELDKIFEKLREEDINDAICISILKDIGIKTLKSKIEETFFINDLDFENQLIITNSRHKDLLKKSFDYLTDAKTQIIGNQPIDIVSIDIKAATRCLGEIIGSDVSQDIIDKIFEKFCLGK